MKRTWRWIGVVVVGWAAAAAADVGPPVPKCSVPPECVSCGRSLSDADSGVDCRAAALDAGLSLSSCSDRSGVSLSEYYCPPGKQAVRGCGCAAGGPLTAFALLALALGRRRRAGLR